MKPLVKHYVLCDHLYVKPMMNPLYNQEVVYLTSDVDLRLAALVTALRDFLAMYERLVNSGDCGNWDPGDDEEVKQAKAALAIQE